MSDVCGQVEVCATGRPLVLRSPTGCGVSECELVPWENVYINMCIYIYTYIYIPLNKLYIYIYTPRIFSNLIRTSFC